MPLPESPSRFDVDADHEYAIARREVKHRMTELGLSQMFEASPYTYTSQYIFNTPDRFPRIFAKLALKL